MTVDPQAPHTGANHLAAVVSKLVEDASDTAATIEVLHIVLGMAPQLPTIVDQTNRLVEDLGYDSLRLIELSVALEERFGIRFDPEVALQIETLDDVARYVDTVAAAAPLTIPESGSPAEDSSSDQEP